MSTINANNITKGTFLMFNGAPHWVTKAEYMSPGKGSPVMRVRFKNVQTGATREFTYKSGEQVEVAEVDKKEMQFLYMEGKDVVFMDPKTFDQASVPVSLLENEVKYLTSNLKCWVLWYNEKAIGVNFPPSVSLKVVDSPDVIAGNTVNAPKKLVKVETGLEVQAPLFVKVGDVIRVDTSTGEYLSR